MGSTPYCNENSWAAGWMNFISEWNSAQNEVLNEVSNKKWGSTFRYQTTRDVGQEFLYEGTWNCYHCQVFTKKCDIIVKKMWVHRSTGVLILGLKKAIFISILGIFLWWHNQLFIIGHSSKSAVEGNKNCSRGLCLKPDLFWFKSPNCSVALNLSRLF